MGLGMASLVSISIRAMTKAAKCFETPVQAYTIEWQVHFVIYISSLRADRSVIAVVLDDILRIKQENVNKCFQLQVYIHGMFSPSSGKG